MLQQPPLLMRREVRTANLLGYEIALARGFVSEGFARPTDRLLLLALGVVGILFVQSQLAFAASSIRGWTPLAGFASGALPGFSIWWPVRRKLSTFADTSILSPEALTPRVRIAYALGYHAVSIALIVGVTLYLAWASGIHPGPGYIAAALCGYPSACLLSFGLARARRRFDLRIHKARATASAPSGVAGTYRETVQSLQLRPLSQMLSPVPGAIGCGLLVGLVCLATFRWAGLGAALVCEICLLGAACFLLTRIDYRLLHFSRFAGITVPRCLAAHTTLVAISCGSMGLLCAWPQPMLAAAALAVGIMTVWLRTVLLLLYSLYPKRIAEFRVQFEIIVVIFVGFIFLPLGLIIGLARPVYLYRVSMRRRWDIS